ncbi:TPA: hypothetical protein ACH3X1_010190 [Trebouxia sp. C0004]
MVVQIKVSGDPRRPNETHAFKMLPPTAEDQTPGALLLLAVGFGMAALLLKVLHKQICPWSELTFLKTTNIHLQPCKASRFL